MRKMNEGAINRVAGSKQELLTRVLRDYQLYIMITPVMVWYIVWCYFPMYGLQLAFKDYSIFKGINDSPWVGVKHFVIFFSGPYAWRVIKNTLAINILNIFIIFPLTIFVALMINEVRCKWFKTSVQTIIYLPHFISAVVVAGLVVTFLSPSSGIVNVIIAALGGTKTYFLAVSGYFRTIFLTMRGWQSIGFGTIIYTSAMCAIDSSLYEAAEIDGAGRFSRIWNITLPGIMPTIAVMLIMKIGHMLQLGSESIILLYQPVTYETADVISSYVYRVGLLDGNYSLSTAVGLFNGVVALILVMIANKISKNISEVGIW